MNSLPSISVSKLFISFPRDNKLFLFIFLQVSYIGAKKCWYMCVRVCACMCVCTDTYSDSDGKESDCNAGDPGSIPWSRRSPGEGNCNPFQYSEQRSLAGPNPWGRKESDTTERLTHTYMQNIYTQMLLCLIYCSEHLYCCLVIKPHPILWQLRGP